MLNKIAEKIKKLLSLAESSNENEARLAAEKANELLVKYNLDLQELGESYDKEYDAEVIYEDRFRKNQQKFIIPILSSHFFVIPIVPGARRGERNYRLCLAGEKTNVEIAKYVHDFLLAAFPRLWKDYKRDNGIKGERFRESYYAGLYQGLDEQLRNKRKQVEEEKGLVVVDHDADLEKWLQEQMGNLKNKKSKGMNIRDAEAAAAGYEQGKKLTINKGISHSAGNQGKLLGGKK